MSARLFCTNVPVNLLLDEALDLLPEERSAVAMALIDSLEGAPMECGHRQTTRTERP